MTNFFISDTCTGHALGTPIAATTHFVTAPLCDFARTHYQRARQLNVKMVFNRRRLRHCRQDAICAGSSTSVEADEGRSAQSITTERARFDELFHCCSRNLAAVHATRWEHLYSRACVKTYVATRYFHTTLWFLLALPIVKSCFDNNCMDLSFRCCTIAIKN